MEETGAVILCAVVQVMTVFGYFALRYIFDTHRLKGVRKWN